MTDSNARKLKKLKKITKRTRKDLAHLNRERQKVVDKHKATMAPLIEPFVVGSPKVDSIRSVLYTYDEATSRAISNITQIMLERDKTTHNKASEERKQIDGLLIKRVLTDIGHQILDILEKRRGAIMAEANLDTNNGSLRPSIDIISLNEERHYGHLHTALAGDRTGTVQLIEDFLREIDLDDFAQVISEREPNIAPGQPSRYNTRIHISVSGWPESPVP